MRRLDLTDRTTPISYWRWYINNPFRPEPQLRLVAGGDDQRWYHLGAGGDHTTTDRSWRRAAFRVADYVVPNSTVQVRFVASDSVRIGDYLDGASIVEAAVDDIQLWDEVDVDGIAESAIWTSTCGSIRIPPAMC
ncbi:MAG: hypothetical protein IPK99_02280 [Flavobacteriales bacterium]|nr:hypothetical protein [Flavobacteriales bacterium]